MKRASPQRLQTVESASLKYQSYRDGGQINGHQDREDRKNWEWLQRKRSVSQLCWWLHTSTCVAKLQEPRANAHTQASARKMVELANRVRRGQRRSHFPGFYMDYSCVRLWHWATG